MRSLTRDKLRSVCTVNPWPSILQTSVCVCAPANARWPRTAASSGAPALRGDNYDSAEAGESIELSFRALRPRTPSSGVPGPRQQQSASHGDLAAAARTDKGSRLNRERDLQLLVNTSASLQDANRSTVGEARSRPGSCCPTTIE
eukprot:96704-Amphidinium_carterae.1